MEDKIMLTEKENKDFNLLIKRLMKFFDSMGQEGFSVTMQGELKKRKYKLLIARADLTSGNCTCFFRDSEDVMSNKETDTLYCDVCKLPIPSVSVNDFNDDDAPQ